MDNRLVKLVRAWIWIVFLAGCAGLDRGCSSWSAGSFGADWIVVQLNANGETVRCWKLGNISVSNEAQSDGIYWKDANGHLIHVSGWYNRVQVKSTYTSADKAFQQAAETLGVDIQRCVGGAYAAPKSP